MPQNEVDWFFGLSNQDLPLGLPMQAIWMVGVAIVIGFLLSRSLFGFRLKAIGESGRRSVGSAADRQVQVRRVHRVLALAALAAMLDFAFIGSVQPNAGVGLLFPVFAAVIIGGASLAGGQGTAVGTLSGALLLAIIANGLALLSAGSYLSNFVSGAVTIAAVVLDRFTQSLRK